MNDTKAILSAYYYGSEHSYAFGPFTQSQAHRFVANDPTPNSHDEWQVTWINDPKLYGTGREVS